ncbi:MAG: glycerol kinase GlpK [Candidatus Dormibacteraceae bacterium]
MVEGLILAIDQGTTGTTVLAVGLNGRPVARGYREIQQFFPRPGWVEHDPEEIWQSVLAATADALTQARSRGPVEVRAVGITNQRETLVLWDRVSGRPQSRAIVWQDRRTAAACDQLRAAGAEASVRRTTGLVIDPYFTATKLRWAIDNVDGARECCAGTIDSWLMFRLTGGRLHATDASNASRTLLLDIDTGGWSESMADLFGVPIRMLPEVVTSSGEVARTDGGSFGGVVAPIAGIAGDQQAALFGQACVEPGMAKNTYGTGSFVLLQTGGRRVASESGMLTTIAWLRDGRLSYALEGSIFVTGAAIQWLRDGLRIIADAAEAGPLAASVPDAGGVFMVPAFTGLGAPHWDPYARGTIVGLTRGSNRAHLVRAAVEAMAYQTCDVVEAMAGDAGAAFKELRVDGGASVMDVLCQYQADLLGLPVRRPQHTESTALGAAFLAGRGAGIWGSDGDLAGLWQLDREFLPAISRDQAGVLLAEWRRAVERSRDWERHNA